MADIWDILSNHDCTGQYCTVSHQLLYSTSSSSSFTTRIRRISDRIISLRLSLNYLTNSKLTTTNGMADNFQCSGFSDLAWLAISFSSTHRQSSTHRYYKPLIWTLEIRSSIRLYLTFPYSTCMFSPLTSAFKLKGTRVGIREVAMLYVPRVRIWVAPQAYLSPTHFLKSHSSDVDKQSSGTGETSEQTCRFSG